MAEDSAQDIAALRKSTGAGMMDCKNALEESEGDKERALDILRAKGMSKANKMQEREATEGAVDVIVDGNVGAIVELNCNTDFVAKGSAFTGLLADVTKLVAASGDGEVADLPLGNSTVGETIQALAGTIAVLVELSGADPSDEAARAVAHEISLHISFAAPAYLTRDDVPADVLAREQAVIEEKSRNEGVPEAKLEGAVKGRLNAFYKDVVLLEQPSVKDPKVSIAKLVEGLGGDVKLTRFARVKVGED
jgi:elongation factor Ts